MAVTMKTSALPGTSADPWGGELWISDDVMVAGPGSSDLTIDAQGNSRVFDVGENVSAEISGLTVTTNPNGRQSSAIYHTHNAI